MNGERPLTPEQVAQMLEVGHGAHEPGSTTGLRYLDYYIAQLRHQADCDPLMRRMAAWETPSPSRLCMGDPCRKGLRAADVMFDAVKRYAWAVPNRPALDAIRAASPDGVLEIGAGAGYWAMELQTHGVDVLAYDPEPPGVTTDLSWHAGRAWSTVHPGDHTNAGDHPERTLLLCWPSYDKSWAAQAIERYHAAGGRTVVYIGEGSGGCTGDERMHGLLGYDAYCWHGGEDCDCAPAPPVLYREELTVGIPSWHGIRDYLAVLTRIEAPA